MSLFGGIKELTSSGEPQKNIIISTGGINRSYEIIDAIFAMDSNKEGFIAGVDPNKAFEGVKQQLSKKCSSLGGDAVIDCEFEYRVAVDGKKQTVEIFAYGTAVRFL